MLGSSESNIARPWLPLKMSLRARSTASSLLDVKVAYATCGCEGSVIVDASKMSDWDIEGGVVNESALSTGVLEDMKVERR